VIAACSARTGPYDVRPSSGKRSEELIDARKHWDEVYATKRPTGVSWYQPHLSRSLALIERAGIGPGDRLIDVGGGASTLVDDLMDRGFRHITVLDVSALALDASQKRLGSRAGEVEWIAGDVLTAQLPQHGYSLWHDRAVFHFLTRPEDRAAYATQVRHVLTRGGFALIASFSPDGPRKCSGLEVCRYSPADLREELGDGFHLVESATENHRTPARAVQAFQYSLLSYAG